MNALTIVLLIYVILDIVSGIGIYAHLRINGWSKWEMARWFRNLMTKPYEDFVEDVYYSIHNLRRVWETDRGDGEGDKDDEDGDEDGGV